MLYCHLGSLTSVYWRLKPGVNAGCRTNFGIFGSHHRAVPKNLKELGNTGHLNEAISHVILKTIIAFKFSSDSSLSPCPTSKTLPVDSSARLNQASSKHCPAKQPGITTHMTSWQTDKNVHRQCTQSYGDRASLPSNTASSKSQRGSTKFVVLTCPT